MDHRPAPFVDQIFIMSDQVPIPPVEEEVPQLVEAIEEPTTDKLSAAISDANVQYGLKNYNAAADLYATAAEMQDSLNGEMNPANAELLYLYGRCLYHVAVAKSDVLGGKIAGEKKKEKKAKPSSNGEGSSGVAAPSGEEKLAGEVVEAAVEAKDGASKEEDNKAENKPYFQFTEEPDSDSDEDEDGEGEGDEGGEDEEDDFANAYEILDLARVLLERQLQAIDANDQLTNGKASQPGSAMDEQGRNLKELLADTHDLQAEISLENERFNDAIPDFRASLELKHALYSKENNIIAEAHYKLSLALEFASVTAIREAQAQESTGGDAAGSTSSTAQPKEAPQVDEKLRSEAAVEMEAAIESCKLRIAKEESDITSLADDAKTKKEKQIQDVREMTEEMEQRLVDLRSPAIGGMPEGFGGANDPENPLSGMLGQMLGESMGEQKKRIEEATRNANDLTNIVRKKKPAPNPQEVPVAPDAAVNGKAKRKLEDVDEVVDADGKRAKTEEIA